MICIDFTVKYKIIIHSYVLEIVSECDQEIPQSQTADNPMAPRGRAAQLPRDTRKKQPASNLIALIGALRHLITGIGTMRGVISAFL